MTTLTNIIGSENGNGRREHYNPIDVAKEVEVRLRAESQTKKLEEKLSSNKSDIASTTEPASFPSLLEKNVKSIYVPGLNLYFSNDIYHIGKSWQECQDILIASGKRMPTIIEYIGFLNHLNSINRRRQIPFNNNIIDSVLLDEGRYEFLDASFTDYFGSLDISYHCFDSDGKIDNQWEQLNHYIFKNKNPFLNLDNWLRSHTPHGLPYESDEVVENLMYSEPKDKKVAIFGKVRPSSFVLDCNVDPTIPQDCIGARYVSLTPD